MRPNLPTGKWRPSLGQLQHVTENNTTPAVVKTTNNTPTAPMIVTTIITESSTITLPIHTATTLSTQALPKYKTMPSPTRPCSAPLNPPQLTLNEIFEESDGSLDGAVRHTPRQFLSRNQTRQTSYEQRRSKFHKTRTASCSSSDASDDDSESRKKRAHKLNNTGKPLPGRRDSHDDSSDSQDPGGSGGTGGCSGVSGQMSRCNEMATQQGPTGSKPEDNKSGNSGGTTAGGRKNHGGQQPIMFGRRHRTGRRRNGETRLRESQSLNRISEVQEDTTQSHSIVIATTLTATQPVTCASPKVKSLGARLLQSWSLGSKKSPVQEENKVIPRDAASHKDDSTNKPLEKAKSEEKENCNKIIPDKSGSRKMRLLGKYFQMHKKICIPLPGLFGRSRLYKAQSCSSLVKDRITPATVDSTLFCNEIMMKNRPTSVPRGNMASDGDINQNLGTKSDSLKTSTVVQLNSVCTGIGGICRLHLGDASKCCSLC